MTMEQCREMMQMMGGGMMGGGMMGGGMMGAMMWPMMLGMLLVSTLVIVGVVVLVRFLWTRSGGQPAAQRILQERLARGEIDREEYQERLSTLQGR